ncbi:MAG: hypothetical protein K2X77_25300 [Candidatus Obscuribacterales bacterium]|nr:hypothetical protein [Candidatus Obscuribacterales bacterium]
MLKFQTIALAAASVVLAAALTACGGTSPEGSTSTSTASPDGSAATSTTTDTATSGDGTTTTTTTTTSTETAPPAGDAPAGESK